MMKKNLKHSAAIALLVCFAVLALGSTTRPQEAPPPPPVQADTFQFISQDHFERAKIIPARDWVPVGLVFITSTAVRDLRGNIVEGSMITNEMIMREVQRLGGVDVINIRRDEIRRITRVGMEVTYKVNALAIRYIDLPSAEWAVTITPGAAQQPGPGAAAPGIPGMLPFLGR